MKRLQTCCCCASTRMGTLITAVLGVILSIITIILVWTMAKGRVTFSTFLFSNEFDEKISSLDLPRIILTISLCFTVIICTVLIIAVCKRRSWLMLPWVVLGIVLAIGLLISVVHTSIIYYKEDTLVATIILVGGLLYLCLYVYLWAVVFSHYLDVRDEEERGRYSKAPYRR